MVAAPLVRRSKATVLDYWPRGNMRTLMTTRVPECLAEGPAGTGKSYGVLQKLHLCASKYAGMRGLIVRKTLESLKASALVTFQHRVLHPLDGVEFYGGSKVKPAAFIYPNGSVIEVAGLDRPGKVMSSEYDVIYINEGTEISESDAESLTTRLRNGVMPYQQLLIDCNPEAPGHWLNQRCNAGKTLRLTTSHQDNPALWDAAANAWTEKGADYIARLDALTGVRRDRLRYGRWVQAEGAIYDFTRDIHIVSKLPFYTTRYLAGVDWGFTNPGVMHIAAVDGDGRVVIVDELYMTGKTMDWWIPKARERQARYRPETWVCDPSQPGYIEQFQQAGLNAVGANNDILPGIDALQRRLVPDATGRPRFAYLADCNKEPDERLREDKKPLSAIDEMDLYVWAKRADGGIRDRPVDEHNHGLDVDRYLVMHLDQVGEWSSSSYIGGRR